MVTVNNKSNKTLHVEYFEEVPVLIGGNIIINQTGAGMYGQNHVVLTKLRNLLSLNITNFNGRLEPINRKKFICFNNFKQLHHNETTRSGRYTTDGLIAHFDNVDVIRDITSGDIIGYSFTYGGTLFKAFFFGRLEKIVGNKRYVCGLNDYNEYTNIDKGWIRFNLDGQSIKMERLIGILGCVYTNLVPESFNKLIVNVMDGSGNLESCQKFGTIPDYRPQNLEWCLNTANRKHGNLIHAIFKKTGHLYRFSAYSKILEEYNDLHSPNDVKAYCDQNFIKVR